MLAGMILNKKNKTDKSSLNLNNQFKYNQSSLNKFNSQLLNNKAQLNKYKNSSNSSRKLLRRILMKSLKRKFKLFQKISMNPFFKRN